MERAKVENGESKKECEERVLLTGRTCFGTQVLLNGLNWHTGILMSPENVFSTDLLLLSERHECQRLHGLILQNSSKLFILHVLWDLKIDKENNDRTLEEMKLRLFK